MLPPSSQYGQDRIRIPNTCQAHVVVLPTTHFTRRMHSTTALGSDHKKGDAVDNGDEDEDIKEEEDESMSRPLLSNKRKLIAPNKGIRTAAQNMVKDGKASSIVEATILLANMGRESLEEKYTKTEISKFAGQGGTKSAINQGKNSNFPGVFFDKRYNKWRVRFNHLGKNRNVGYYTTELDAAIAHDEFVISNKLDRKLHLLSREEDDGKEREDDKGESRIEIDTTTPINKFPGVIYDKRTKKWRVKFSYQSKVISVGYYKTQLDAIHGHNTYIIQNDLDRQLHDYDLVSLEESIN